MTRWLMSKIRIFICLFGMLFVFATVSAYPKTLFFDDFEDDLSQWKILGGNVTIAADDAAGGNHVMDFNGEGQNIVAVESHGEAEASPVCSKGRCVSRPQRLHY